MLQSKIVKITPNQKLFDAPTPKIQLKDFKSFNQTNGLEVSYRWPHVQCISVSLAKEIAYPSVVSPSSKWLSSQEIYAAE
jgi:hypothetical protein